MKKYILVLLVLFNLLYKINLFAGNEEIRHLWLHPNRYCSSDDSRHEYFQKANAIGANAIFMFVPTSFAKRPNFISAILDSASNRNMKVFIAISWGIDYDDIENGDNYLYRPMNLSDEQWNRCIKSATRTNRGLSAGIDKTNIDMRRHLNNELLKYFKEYPKLAGVVWDASRLHGRFGSFSNSNQKYTIDNSNIDVDLLKNEVYGKFPMPAFRTLNSVGSTTANATTCKILARYYDKTEYNLFGITLQEHENRGSCLCLHRNSSAFEIPLYSTVCKKIIKDSGYTGDTLYIKKSKGVNNVVYEFAFSMDYIGKFVKNVEEVPNGAPYVTVNEEYIDSTSAATLTKHANSGACIIIGQPPYSSSSLKHDVVQKLVGFNRSTYVSPKVNKHAGYKTPKYLYLTDEGKNYGFPETSMDINAQIKIAEDWMNWNANEMLGGCIRDLKIEMKKRYSDRKLNIACTKYDSDPWFQQQDWATWIKNGYTDYNVAMLYQNNIGTLDWCMNVSRLDFDSDDLYQKYYQPILDLSVNTGNHQMLSEQATLSLKQHKLSGFGIFEGTIALNEYSIEDLQNIRSNINNGAIPKFYFPEERPIKFINNQKADISFRTTIINLENCLKDSTIFDTLLIENNGENYLDVVNIKIDAGNDDGFTIITDTSFILDKNEQKKVIFSYTPQNIGKIHSQIIIHTNVENSEILTIPVYGKCFNKYPTMVISNDNINFKTTALSDTSKANIIVRNLGFEKLDIKKLFFLNNSENYSFDISNSNISIYDSSVVRLNFHPKNKNYYENTIGIISNDP